MTPSSFLCSCSFKDINSSSDYYLKQFINLAGQAPNVSLETRNYAVHILVSPSTKMGTDSTGTVHVILHGEIYESLENQAAYLAEKFAHYEDNFIKDIHGSFAILLVDQQKDRVSVITDRINSRRIFWSRYPEGFCISSKFSDQPWETFSLDPVGIAWYLSNVKIRNHRTLLDGVLTFERATIHNLTKEGIKANKYWIFQIEPSALNANRKKLDAQLYELLIQSVQRRIYDNPDLFLSLSGGYDSRVILGILASNKQYPNVYCFSYDYGLSKHNSDGYISRLVADSVSYPHETVESYTGNFINHIIDNAEMGLARGLSSYCAELEAWKTLAQRFDSVQHPIMLTGDECLGRQNSSLQTWLDVLTSLKIYGFEVLAWAAPFLPDEIYDQFNHGLAEDIEKIVKSCPPTTNLRDSEYLLKLDQIIANWIMPWRDNFAGSFVNIRYPLLDNDILEFMTTVPTNLRQGKRIYRQLITKMYPQLFRLPRAKIANHYLNLREEFINHAPAITSLIKKQESRLDEIIPPDLLLKLLKDILVNENYTRPLQSKKSKGLSQVFSRIQDKFSYFFPRKFKVYPVSPANLLLRLMILRTALSPKG